MNLSLNLPVQFPQLQTVLHISINQLLTESSPLIILVKNTGVVDDGVVLGGGGVSSLDLVQCVQQILWIQ